MTISTLPILAMRPKASGRVRGGHPWVYGNEIQKNPDLAGLPAGSPVRLTTDRGDPLGTVAWNPKPLVVGRLLSREAVQPDAAFFEARLRQALRLRERLFGTPYYRLIHAEADGLPGLVIDRFGELATVQLNSAFADLHRAPLLAALDAVLAPTAVIVRLDSPARTLEGLALSEPEVIGTWSGPVPLEENGTRFQCDPLDGQKTGWFYDHRPTRAFAASLARGKRVLDMFSYIGAFGITAANAGAAEVLCVDRSQHALDHAQASAALNGVADRVRTEAGDAFSVMEKLAQAGDRFDIVIVDPPAFVKSKKDLKAGLRGYQKMTRLGAALVADEGIFVAASCSHNVDREAFQREVSLGLSKAGRSGRILQSGGAGPDHPVHPFLRESAYLKAEIIALA
ncbi:MAG: class I SAM-dependent rRNA methyltransferase [Alphaproteobacteria bacterium]|nr:class I SAM-dependent rRNA methyltransferase [Alphaproteobacteria bacterium]